MTKIWRMKHRLLAALVMSASAMTSSAAAPRFHFELIRSTPANGVTLKAAPVKLQLWFTQVPARGVSRLTLRQGDADIALTTTSTVAESKSMLAEPRAPLAPGAYTIAWRGAGDDGHVQNGTISFVVAGR